MATSRVIPDRIAIFLLLLLTLFPGASGAAAPSATTTVYLFWAQGCPHCEREIAYMKRLEAADPQVRVRYFEITRDARNRALLFDVARQLGIQQVSVPFTVIGDEAVVGYLSDEVTGAALRQRAQACAATGCPDPVAALLGGTAAPTAGHAAEAGALSAILRLPLVGEVSVRNLSLPALTLILGALDGFNPCAMWTLIFLIGLLVGLKDKKRMWALGGAFIAGSAAVYFLFMAAWLSLLLFLGMVVWVRLGIGVVALAGGYWYVREYLVNRENVCPVTAPEHRRRVFERLRALASEQSFLLALAGILLLAFAVNLVELLCSAGIPAVYTQVLAMSNLPRWQHYAYLALYIFVFMLDDLIVFLAAMTTLQATGLTTRYARYSHLIGGVVLLAIGAVMLLRPEWLMFG
jgi:glutaredoxin